MQATTTLLSIEVLESHVLGNLQAWFGEGCDPFSRNLVSTKGMRGKGRRGL